MSNILKNGNYIQYGPKIIPNPNAEGEGGGGGVGELVFEGSLSADKDTNLIEYIPTDTEDTYLLEIENVIVKGGNMDFRSKYPIVYVKFAASVIVTTVRDSAGDYSYNMKFASSSGNYVKLVAGNNYVFSCNITRIIKIAS